MIGDCYAGKNDVIVTKSVSRFAQNVADYVSIVRKLAHLNPPAGVVFEKEGIFSIDNASEMVLAEIVAATQEKSNADLTIKMSIQGSSHML